MTANKIFLTLSIKGQTLILSYTLKRVIITNNSEFASISTVWHREAIFFSSGLHRMDKTCT